MQMKRDREYVSIERINESNVESKQAGLCSREAVIMAGVQAVCMK